MGSTVRFDFRLASGERLLLGEGVVTKVKEGRSKSSIIIRFTKLNRASKELVDQVLAFKAAEREPVEDVPSPEGLAVGEAAPLEDVPQGEDSVSDAPTDIGGDAPSDDQAEDDPALEMDSGPDAQNVSEEHDDVADHAPAPEPNLSEVNVPQGGVGQLTSAGNLLEALFQADGISADFDDADDGESVFSLSVGMEDEEGGLGLGLDEAEVDDV